MLRGQLPKSVYEGAHLARTIILLEDLLRSRTFVVRVEFRENSPSRGSISVLHVCYQPKRADNRKDIQIG